MATDYYVMEVCVRNWLSYIHKSDERISYLETRILEIKSRLIGLGYNPASQGSGSAADAKIPDGIAALEELEAEWNNEVLERTKEIEFAKYLCCEKNVEQHLVWLRFVEHKKWDDLAKSIGYSKRHTQRRFEFGIKSLYPYVPDWIKVRSFPNAAAL